MITNAYAIYDRKGLIYHPPFWAATDGLAVRMLQDTVNDPNTTLSRHPGDYVLYRVGAYDDASGSLLPVTAIQHVADALALVTTQPPIFPETTRANGKDHHAS